MNGIFCTHTSQWRVRNLWPLPCEASAALAPPRTASHSITAPQVNGAIEHGALLRGEAAQGGVADRWLTGQP